MKKIMALLLAVLMCFGLSACGNGTDDMASDFYDKVSDAKDYLDYVADDIYSNWYDYVYNSEYDSADDAVNAALADNESNINKLESLDVEINDLFDEIKDSEYGSVARDVMSAYEEYYEFVIDVSGSFNSFSENKDDMKQELSEALKDLSYELR